MTAKLNGIHCGRPLKFCWSDEILSHGSEIRTEGKGRTVIQSVDTVMDFARQGMTVSGTARTIGVSRMTLRRALRSKGLEAEFDRLREENRTKGMAHRRVVDCGENTLKREGLE